MTTDNKLSNPKSHLFTRNATLDDVPANAELSVSVYKGVGMDGCPTGALCGQIHTFPGGQYAQCCILTPCDFPFARDGIAADTTSNVETVAIADLRPETLMLARNNGTVKNLRDRRHDLYQLQ